MVKDPHARIVGKKNWQSYFLLTLESSRIAAQAQPGQFIMVRVSAHPHPLLRRPFSIHSRREKMIEIFFQVTGLGTKILSQKNTEDPLDILGPLGQGFETGKALRRTEAALVGGGRGIAPLYFLAQELRRSGASARIFYGGKTREDLPLKEKFEEENFDLSCSTDDGSTGYEGLVSDLFQAELERYRPDRLYACGPDPMMKKLSKTALEKDIPAEFSLESLMGCGFGACWGCVKKIRRNKTGEWVKICEEGPVFSGQDIIWEEEGE